MCDIILATLVFQLKFPEELLKYGKGILGEGAQTWPPLFVSCCLFILPRIVQGCQRGGRTLGLYLRETKDGHWPWILAPQVIVTPSVISICSIFVFYLCLGVTGGYAWGLHPIGFGRTTWNARD